MLDQSLSVIQAMLNGSLVLQIFNLRGKIIILQVLFMHLTHRLCHLILIQELLEDPLQQMQFNFNLIMGNSYIRLLAPQ